MAFFFFIGGNWTVKPTCVIFYSLVLFAIYLYGYKRKADWHRL